MNNEKENEQKIMQELDPENLTEVSGGKLSLRSKRVYGMYQLVDSKRKFGHTQEETIEYLVKHYSRYYTREQIEEFVIDLWDGLKGDLVEQYLG